MKNSSPDFPPLTERHLDLLNQLKAEIEKRDSLSALDPEMPKINVRIDDISIKALRFALKPCPKESLRPGKFFFVFNSTGEYAQIKLGFGNFHPDLPPWAENHFIEWIRMLRSGGRRPDASKILRKTGIVGIETGMKRPVDMDFLIRVLELRGYKGKNDPGEEDGPIPDSFGEMLDQSRRLSVTDEMLEQRDAEEKKKIRTRKEDLPWHWVIKKLVEKGLLPKEISVQAFKKMLKNRYPFHPWDET